jgi:NADH dehydrogenase
MTAGTLSLTQIVHHQVGMWYIVPQFVGFLIFMVASFAETNRAPFDLVEADAELVGGYFTEYGGTRMVAYLFAEYMNMCVVSLIAVTVFLGGWLLPFGINPPGWVDPFIVLGKMTGFLIFFIWIRATLPRLRYDQLMTLGWKVLIPGALAWTLMIATIRVWRREGGSPGVYLVAGGIVVILMALAWGWDTASARQQAAAAGADGAGGAGGASGEDDGAAGHEDDTGGRLVTRAAGSFPIPALDLPHYRGEGVTAAVVSGPVAPGSAGKATVADTAKEVTGA